MIAVGPDNEIYVGGRALDPLVYFAMSITRFSPAGVLDGSFATPGTRRLQRLGSKAAARDIAAETRAVLVADTGALATEVESLAAAIP